MAKQKIKTKRLNMILKDEKIDMHRLIHGAFLSLDQT
jgi:hypothetical protein